MATSKIHLLIIGGVPDDNRAEVRRWTPNGVDLLYDGNVTADAIMRDERLEVMQLILGGSNPSRDFNLTRRPDVAFNLVCNAESSARSLDMSDKVCASLARDGIPVLNPPDRVRGTTRTASAALFAGLDRIEVPEVRKLESPNMRSIQRLLDSKEISYPSIVRTATDHNGANMIRLRGPRDLEKLERLPFDGRDYCVSRFIDYRDPEGLYGKLRLVKVGRKFLPRHLIVSADWKIHSGQRAEKINASSESRARERAYLQDPSTFLGESLYGQLVTGLERTGLDYVGVDFGLLGDGRAVFFECNACTNAATRSSRPGEDPERATIKKKIGAAFFECVQQAAQAQQPEKEHEIQ